MSIFTTVLALELQSLKFHAADVPTSCTRLRGTIYHVRLYRVLYLSQPSSRHILPCSHAAVLACFFSGTWFVLIRSIRLKL